MATARPTHVALLRARKARKSGGRVSPSAINWPVLKLRPALVPVWMPCRYHRSLPQVEAVELGR